jgi:lipooligosaccharide transport system permease protein
MSILHASRLVEREALVFSKVWHASVFSAFVMPVLFLAAMGLGVGGLVDDGSSDLGGLSYLHFVAPGLLVGASAQVASWTSMWSVLGGVKWDRRYLAMVATPLAATDVYAGFLAWIAVRVALTSTLFLMVAAVMGGLDSWWAPLAIPATMLTGVAFASVLGAYAITRDDDATFTLIVRLGFMPLYLFSGTFFPVENLPDALETLAWLSPLWHGVELARHATTGTGDAGDAVLHVAALLAVIALGARWGRRTFPRTLTP